MTSDVEKVRDAEIFLYSKNMNRHLVMLFCASALFLSGCANDLTPEPQDRPAAAFAPEASSYVPNRTPQTNFGGGRGGY